MVEERNPRSKSAGRRPGRNTTFQAEAYKDDPLDPIDPQDLLDPESTGSQPMEEGYFQPTAMLDKGELLGELKELAEIPNTKAVVTAEAPPKGCRLIVVAGPDLGVEWAFKKPEVVIGRDEECDLQMSDIAVSRRHAKIALDRDRFVLHDFGSGNGTFLNGVRVTRETLASGDEIIIGERTLRFVELNEAPPTAAAHPIPEKLAPEPQVGHISKVVAAKDPALSKAKSQIDVGVVPKEEGPAPNVGSVNVPPPSAQPQQGAALRKVLTAVGAIVFAGALVFAGLWYWRWDQARKSIAEQQIAAKREFLQAIELVKAKRFGDALMLFERVLSVTPEYDRALEYKAHCDAELAVWKTMEEARALAANGRAAEGLEKLNALKGDTAYAEELEKLKSALSQAVAEALIKEARGKLDAGDFEAAMELAMAALTQAPQLDSAQALRDDIEDAKRDRDKKPIKKPETPPDMLRAVALYKNEQIAAAMDAAEATGGPNAATYVARMKRVKQLLQEAEVAHKKKAAAELLRIAPAILELDDQIALGEGKVRAKLRRWYADGLYLKGIEAYQEKDYVRAYQLWSDALVQQPAHQLSETRLAELQRKARDMYYDGYVLKDTNAAETRKIFKRLVQMTRPDNQYHKLAQKWLAANGG
jgi:tetratricopeptide (TPR) repeat protein